LGAVSLRFHLEATDGAARAGRLVTARGEVPTPVFMPVGTRGAVKTLDTADLERLGLPIILGNTYHLMERPGADVIAQLGGLHAFNDWGGHILTDSGGYQIFSLEPSITEDGAAFASVYDGSRVLLGPERAVAVQEQLGADIAMVLDVCPPLPSPRHVVVDAAERSVRWAERCRAARTRSDQAQFGIVQGGVDPELRADSARRTVDIGFEGYAVGGLSVGEGTGEMLPALEAAVGELPADQPRYFMGLGDPVGIVEAVARGIDMFDCVLPTRLARHGTALTSEGRLNLKGARFARDDGPIDPGFQHELSSRYSRAYLRHLFVTHELTGGRILTLHNLAWLADLTRRARAAICDGTFEALRSEVAAVWR
jgi:queuine tRNA-ribosyltransferase